MKLKTRIMYIERKDDGIVGPARIGRVAFSKSGKSIYYKGKEFCSLNGSGFKANYFEVVTRQEYWISGCKVKEEYWTEIRNQPKSKDIKLIRCAGKYAK